MSTELNNIGLFYGLRYFIQETGLQRLYLIKKYVQRAIFYGLLRQAVEPTVQIFLAELFSLYSAKTLTL